MLFEPQPSFSGLPADGFEVFGLEDREARRRAIIERIHPALSALGADLMDHLQPRAAGKFHAHLPRLDWPRGYQPFCTWLALSSEAHGYQAGPQLNVGVHQDYVVVRLGWDTSAPSFGRFEFLCSVGHLGPTLLKLASPDDLLFRVYAAERWPQGSRVVLETADDLAATFREVKRRGVWWELGRVFPLAQHRELLSSPEFGNECRRIFDALLPVYERIEGDVPRDRE